MPRAAPVTIATFPVNRAIGAPYGRAARLRRIAVEKGDTDA
jgi:hypothetical protein